MQWHQMVAFRIVQCHPGLTYLFNFRHSGTLALRIERQSARMSKLKNRGLDQYGTEQFQMLPYDATAL